VIPNRIAPKTSALFPLFLFLFLSVAEEKEKKGRKGKGLDSVAGREGKKAKLGKTSKTHRTSILLFIYFSDSRLSFLLLVVPALCSLPAKEVVIGD